MVRRPPIHRLPPALLSTFALAVGFGTVGTLRGQQPPHREEARPMEFLGSQDDNLFSLTRSQEDIHEWDLALAELQKGEAPAAVERLHRLLRTEIGGVAPVAPGRFLGLRLAVVTTLANLPPAAVEAYEALVQREVGNLGSRPLHELDPDQLAQLAQRFPTAAIGRSARLRLGDLALEAGLGLTAVDHYRLALDSSPIGSAHERVAHERLQCAAVLVQPRTARAAAAARTLPAPALAVLDLLPPTGDPSTIDALGCGGGRTPMALPAGSPVLVTSEEVTAIGFDRRADGSAYAMFPIGDLDGIYVNTGRDLKAFDPLRRGFAWEWASPLREVEQSRWSNGGDEEQINPDMVLAAACGDDVVVAAMQVPDKSANVDFNNGLRIIYKMPQRRLFGFARATGKMLWSHWDELDGPKTRRMRGHDACGPPLVVGDTVYAPIHDRSGAIAFSVGAYDLHTGALKWRRLVCSSQQEVNMFGNARMEFAASPLAVADGLLYGAANLGVVFALELATGRVRWITAHEVVNMPMTRIHGQQSRPVFFANNAPAITAGVACFTPLDSPSVLGLDCETGRLLWRLPASAAVDGLENDVRWLAGVLDDEFVLAGRGAIAVKARTNDLVGGLADARQLVRPERLRDRGDTRSMGRPAVTADHVWFPAPGRIQAFDRAGNAAADVPQIQGQRFLPGNLLFVDGIVVSLRQNSLDVLAADAALQATMEARLRQAPEDPSAILRLANLRAALLPEDAPPSARLAVTGLYRRGLDASIQRGLPKSHPVRQALQRELFTQAMQAAVAAMDRNDPAVVERLAEARDTAPDQRAWLRVQLVLIDQLQGSAVRLRQELDRLETEAGTASLTLGEGTELPVRAYVLWRRAQLPGQPAATAVALWQELLENHPTAPVGRELAAAAAEAAIQKLVAAHGAEAYAAVAQRAAAALAGAGDDVEALRHVCDAFPNSTAAATARTRLLDRSVKAGDLAMAISVLAAAQRGGAVAPGISRRVLVAALVRGNRALAQAMGQHLLAHRDVASDWPEDAGATYGAVVAALQPQFTSTAPLPALTVPSREITRIVPRSPREAFRWQQVVAADGFDRPADAPVFVIAAPVPGAELLAIDIHAPGAKKPVLWNLPLQQYPEHLVLCGTTLIVPDLERLVAVDYRSGVVRWELPSGRARSVDSLGVMAGVLHVSITPDDPDGGAEFLGIEPTTGAVLFTRQLPADRMKPMPKAVAGQLLVMQSAGAGGANVLRLDPLSGVAVATVPVDAAVLRREAEVRPDGLATRVYPQGLCADAQHIYLPLDSTFSGDAPQLLAIDDRGKVVWSWQGQADSHLAMAAWRSGRLVVVESSENRPGRVSLLAATDGTVLRSTALGTGVDILNWQRTWLQNPAPAALLLSDTASEAGGERRLVCFAVDEGLPSFLEPLGREDDEVERQPQFGPDFLVFGVRSTQGGSFRLHARKLTDRSGALPDGEKYLRLRVGATHGMAAAGPYTVLSSTSGLLVLGSDEGNK